MAQVKEFSEIQEIIAWLVAEFPKAFFTKASDVKPLQLGILDDILEFYYKLNVQPYSRKKLRAALNFYTSTRAYLSSQQQGAYRINLFGESVERVTEEQMHYAKEKFAARFNRKKESEPLAPSSE